MSGYPDRMSARDAVMAVVADLDAALDAWGRFAPGSDEPHAQLDRATVRRALEGFASGDVSAAVLERWAEAIHSADDVTLDPAEEDFLSEALFELSTPELFGSMEEIVARLRELDRNSPQV